MTLNYHGLEWYEGDISIKRLYKNLEDICMNCRTIFVRGQEKLELLSKLTTCKIENLEKEQDCPAFRNLNFSSIQCMHHYIKSSYSNYACALYHVANLKHWLLKLDTSVKLLIVEGIFEILCDELKKD
ncbi:hypothetical protein, partial [Escherichia coli]|uniref:hypothetical protein n=1 Tax=Escherichia coli TaxID=562 RepID=UPI00291622AC